jgi:aspartate aminotransferase-like enzyme
VNIHETSTGVHYDGELIADFCRRNGLLLVVDAISSFLADPCPMEAWGVDVMITGSQKALAALRESVC